MYFLLTERKMIKEASTLFLDGTYHICRDLDGFSQLLVFCTRSYDLTKKKSILYPLVYAFVKVSFQTHLTLSHRYLGKRC